MPGQVVLITGAAVSIIHAAVRAFARAGARVVAADLDEGGAHQAADLARAEGAEALAVQADVASSASVQALVAAAVARVGRLDAAVNNAGVA
ncbi:MAG: short-chain dehydrogenase, partial [Burkholderiales bacterium PBB5]